MNWRKQLNPMGVFSHFGERPHAVLELQQVLDANRFGQAIRRNYAMVPSVKLNIRMDDGQGIQSALEALAQLFLEVPGDVLMLSPDDVLLLRRHEGQLTLNSQSPFWSSEIVSYLGLPFDLLPLDKVSWS